MVLDVVNLAVSFDTPDGVVAAVRGISFGVRAGQTTAIVGESGAGKSVAAHAMLGLVPGARVSGAVMYEGRNLLALDERSLRDVRGAEIAMVFQNPQSSLHPALRVGDQIDEAIRLHTSASRREARSRTVELLEQVGIANALRRADDYPHQFSGGMLQRAMIAMAIALKPRILIADEPTTALDVSVQWQILRLLRRLQDDLGLAVILITHDLGVVASMADDVVVMYAGRAMEHGARVQLLSEAHHPYTRGLLSSLPRIDRRERLSPIPGQPPPATNIPAGCPFHPRCTFKAPRCVEPQPLYAVGGALHRSACWLPASGTA
jgi:oligopeptide/dipeptide ABC transporter ATP-binding protein